MSVDGTGGPTTMGYVANLADSLGTTEPALRLLLTVFLGYPVAWLHRQYLYGKDAQTQHLYFALSGFLLGYWNFGWDILHTTANMLVIYALLKIIGGTLHSVLIALSFNMAYLLIGYLMTETETYDIIWTMPHCILALRLSGLAFDLYDGHQPPESLSKDSQQLCIKKAPSLLEISAYTYFPTGFIVGPQFPIRRYFDFIDQKFKEPHEIRPNTVGPAIKRGCLGLVYLFLFQVASIRYNDNFLLSEEYANMSYPRRMLDLGIWGHVVLYKYVSCWLINEGACILVGLTYNGRDKNGQIKWDGLANIKISLFETAQNFSHQYIGSFNCNTNFWVLQYIYKRLKFLGNKYYSQLGVLLFLAVWHGFHSGYYMTFFMEFISVAMEKEFEVIFNRNEKAVKFLQRPGIFHIRWIICRLYVLTFMGACVAPLALRTYDKWWIVHKNIYFTPIIFWLSWPLYKPIVKKLLAVPRSERDLNAAKKAS